MEYLPYIVLSVFLIIVFVVTRGLVKKGKIKIPGFEAEIEAPEPVPQTTDSSQGNTVHYHLHVTQDQRKAELEDLGDQFKKKLTEPHQGTMEDREILLKQLNASEQKLSNLEKEVEEKNKLLNETAEELQKLKTNLPTYKIAQAMEILQYGDTSEAENLFKEFLETQEEAIEQSAEAAYSLGQLAENRLDYKSAQKYLRRAMQLNPNKGHYFNNYGLFSYNLGKYDDAIEYYSRALDIYLDQFDEEHYEIPTIWSNLGEALRAKGDYKKAFNFSKKALEKDLENHGENHPDVAVRWNNLGVVLNDMGEIDQAIDYHKKALDSNLRNWGENHPRVVLDLNNLGDIFRTQGNYKKSLEYFNKVLAVVKKVGLKHQVDCVENNIRELQKLMGGESSGSQEKE